MRHLTLHDHGDGLVHLVAHHASGQGARGFRLCALFAHAHCPAFSFVMVRTRAILRRTVRSFELSASWPVACCLRRLNCSRSRPSSSFSLSSADRARMSFGFMTSPFIYEALLRFAPFVLSLDVMARNEGGA